MMPRLSAISIENMRPRGQRYAVPDSGCRGLYLNVYPTGRKSWSVRYRFGGVPRNLTLEGFPPLALARKAAMNALAEVDQGRDPAAAKLISKTATAQRESDTIERLAAQFIEQHAKRKTRVNSWRATVSIFNRIVLPTWMGRTVHGIRRRDVIDLLEEVAGDRPIMANRTHAALSRFFRWLCERDVIVASPCIGVPLPSKETPRDRVLSDEELRRLWLACADLDGRESACVRLLILTGQRRGEIAGLRWVEVDGDVLMLPAERMKGRVAHIVPLSTQAAAILALMPQLVPQVPRPSDCVFGSPIGHFDRIKRALDARMGDVPKWVIHDIRRSVASGMARIGVSVPAIEKILAHRSGTFRGVAGTYQRHSFLPEMAAALQRWADHIDQLVTGKPAKVVKLRR
jgi:integrase